jgi:putative transposase
MVDKSKRFELIHEIMSTRGNILDLNDLCQTAGVSRSGYYKWIRSEDVRREKEEKDRADFELVLEAFKHRGYDKGVRGINMYLLHRNPQIIMNPKKIRRLMHKYGLLCPIRKANPYRRMAAALKTSNYADNLVKREFEQHGPRMILLTDITYLPYNDTFAYLSTIIDGFTKQVLSYVLSENLKVDFVLQTVEQLLENHGISLSKETIIHSDQGAHYSSCSFIEIVNNYNLRQSMSRRGNCWDNAPQESFFGHMKDEIDISQCIDFAEVKHKIDDWIQYYNDERYQWQLAKLSPNQYYDYITTGKYPLA